ncbi:MAG: HDOD domain-containing protein, partial [Burkholderiales bacterium]
LSQTHHAAFQARDLAVLYGDTKAEEVYIATQLYFCAELVVQIFAAQYAQKIDELVCRDIEHAVAEKQVLGVSYAELSQMLVTSWRLPALFHAMLEQEDRPNPRRQCMRLGINIAHEAVRGWYTPAAQQAIEEVAEFLHWSIDDAVRLTHRDAILVAHLWDWYGATPAAAFLALLPGEG